MPPLLTHAIVRVTVEDENDHTPTFGNTHLSLEVPEGQDPQTLTTLRASDPDRGLNGQLQYRILGERRPVPQEQHLLAWFLLLLGPCQFVPKLRCLLSLLVSSFSFLMLGVFKLPLEHLQFFIFLYIYFFLSISFLVAPHKASCSQTVSVSGTLKTLFYVIGSSNM